jgi:hypothetical protein
MARINPGRMMVDDGGGYEPLIAVAVQAAVASPAVVNTPANVAPKAAEVEKVVTAVIKAVAPDDSDNRLRQIAKQATQAVVTNPAVIAAPAGQTVNTTTIQGIIASSVKMPYDSTKPATTVTMPFDGTTTPSVKNLDTITLDRDVANTKTSAPVPTPTPTVTSKPDPTKTAYADLTPAQRAAMTQDEKTDYLAAAREFKMAEDAKTRAESDPMFDFANRPTAPTPKPGMINYYSWIGGTKDGQWKLYEAADTPENQAKYGARSVGGATAATPNSAVGANTLVTPSPGGTPPPGGNPPPRGNLPLGGNPPLGSTTTRTGGGNDAIANATKYAADLQAASEAAAVKSQRLSAWAVLKAEFDKYGLGTLADAVKEMIINGTPSAQATMILRERPEYKARFAGNEARRTAGLNVYDEGTYLDLENAMAEIFTAYGQKSLMGATREQQQATFAKYIGGTIAPTELKRRMDIASTLSKSDNSTIKAIKELYPMINDGDIFAYFLKPEETLPKLEAKAQAASIGGAFLAQKLKINTASMEEYAALGISREQAQLGAAQIASVLPRAAQLRAYENGTYTQQQAEDVYLRQSAAAKKELEDLAKLETGRMSGASGTSKVSLKSASRNTF